MRYALGPTFAYSPSAPTAAPTSPTGKADPITTHKGVKGNVAAFDLDAYDPATHNILAEVLIFVVPETDTLHTDANDYVKPPAGVPSYPFGKADVANLQTGAKDVPITLPPVPDVPHHGQYVWGYLS